MRSNESGMNYQQRNRALFECIRERCGKTGCNPYVDCVHAADITANLMFNVYRCFIATLPYA
jgi:hypothetical protein